MSININNFTIEELDQIATILVKDLKGGSIVVIEGEMGSGKTTLVKACGLVLGVQDEITSPTFSIIEEHKCISEKADIKKIIHVDTYRIEFENELYELGFDDIFDSDAVTFIEWGERIEQMLDDQYFLWSLTENLDGSRSIKIESKNEIA